MTSIRVFTGVVSSDKVVFMNGIPIELRGGGYYGVRTLRSEEPGREKVIRGDRTSGS